MDKSILDQFRLTVAEKHYTVYGIKVETGDGDSAIHMWRSNDRLSIYSGSKTFTSLAVGMCIDEGRLSYSDRVLDFFPEYRDVAAPGTEKATVHDLLRMAVGKFEHFLYRYTPEPGAPGMPRPMPMDAWNTPKDWAAEFFKIPQTAQPGEKFFYANTSPYMCSRIVENVSGSTMLDYLRPRLFDPMEIYNPCWPNDPCGHTQGWSKLMLNVDEYSRLGQLLLHNGEYRGKQLVSQEYVRRMHSDWIDSSNCALFHDHQHLCGYGYYVWKCDYLDAYRAEGKYGKLCIVIPSKNVVVTCLMHEDSRVGEVIDAIFADVVDRI